MFQVYCTEDENTCYKYTVSAYRKIDDQHKVIVARGAIPVENKLHSCLKKSIDVQEPTMCSISNPYIFTGFRMPAFIVAIHWSSMRYRRSRNWLRGTFGRHFIVRLRRFLLKFFQGYVHRPLDRLFRWSVAPAMLSLIRCWPKTTSASVPVSSASAQFMHVLMPHDTGQVAVQSTRDAIGSC